MNCTAQPYSGLKPVKIKSGNNKKSGKEIECICKEERVVTSTPKRCELCGEIIY